jgi:hypothetical protein
MMMSVIIVSHVCNQSFRANFFSVDLSLTPSRPLALANAKEQQINETSECFIAENKTSK